MADREQQIKSSTEGTVGAREASTTEGGVGCGGGAGMRRAMRAGRMARPGGVDDDGGAAETSSTTADGAAGRG